MTRLAIRCATAMAITATILLAVLPASSGETERMNRWSVSAMGGWINFEGDEPVKDAALVGLSVGYELSRRWTLEGVIEYCPDLKSSYRRDWATGERISRMSEGAGRELTDTSALRFALDGLLHLAPESRLDPYLAAGIGLAAYENDFDQRNEPFIRVGAGLFANITRCWALRLDSRVILAGDDTEANLTVTAGLAFRPGRGLSRSAGGMSAAVAPLTVVPPVFPEAAPPVAAPAAPEAVKMFELNLSFDPGKWDIKAEYRSELDVIGRLLDTRPAATARIEGHEQADDATDEKDAQLLSARRAEAVRDYLKEHWKINSSRLESVGFGTSRPNSDTNRSSERIEVYVTLP